MCTRQIMLDFGTGDWRSEVKVPFGGSMDWLVSFSFINSFVLQGISIRGFGTTILGIAIVSFSYPTLGHLAFHCLRPQ